MNDTNETTRRDFLSIGSTALGGAVLASLLGRHAHADGKRPNIILIMADDLGAECLGCYGGTSYRTPNLDAMAAAGLRFEHCYATPLCSPSRALMMTGRYGFRTGWNQLIDSDDAGEFFDPAKEKTFGHVLKDAGYATAIAGKWQLCQFDKHPQHLKECGFDESCMWTWVTKGKRTERYWDPSIWQNGQKLENTEKKYGPDIFCDFLCDFMTRNRERPFFVYYPMALVHNPFVHTPDSKGGGKGKSKAFGEMVAYMDKVVGRLTAKLDELRIRENTLVLFTGDNGTDKSVTSELNGRKIPGGKNQLSEAGTRVPLIAQWKGTAPAGKVLPDLVDFSDFMPTVAELGEAKLPPGVTIDGRSFAAQLKGQPGKPREWVFIQLGKERFARDARWRLHNTGQLYDLKDDPYESKPLAKDDAEAAAARGRLQAVLNSHK